MSDRPVPALQLNAQNTKDCRTSEEGRMRVVTLSEPLGMPPAERDAYCTEQRGRWGKHARMTVVVRRFFDQPAV